MATRIHSRRLHWGLHLVAGGLLMALAVLPTLFLELAGCWLALREPLIEAGCIVILAGFVTYRPRIAKASAGLALGISLFVAGVGVAEGLGRLLRLDFRGAAAAARRLPPYYRIPTVPTGEVFFRRLGPQQWRGRVIHRALRELGIQEDLYSGEPEITVRYDEHGFRNEPGLRDWELAVCGDSFTELGFLPDELLFTQLLAQRLGQRVKNLGVSNTGPLTHLHYLKAYGLGPSTRRVAIMFFEGNDLEDLHGEYQRLRWFEKTGKRPAGRLKRQSSLLRALGEALVRPATPRPPATVTAAAAFLELAGKRTPVEFSSAPAAAADIVPEVREALEYFVGQYAALARDHELEAWLFYLPAKLRVWQGRLHFTEEAPEVIREWQPTDLPAHLGALARGRGLRFFDLTPALIEATRTQKALLFNPRFDTHLNAAGSAVVAEAMARILKPAG
ncbi:MAG TPA: hypothetical protein PKM73_12790 [Verrucomicrobiota bacterium]|nr:hypothetical protein [Verrucomicrobiota bacterium]HNU51604.1 hypothetical protein [Verrucomicrobiota bacterium]